MEIAWLAEAASEDWSRVNPAIFGTLFEGSMEKKERHAFGAHFTSATDILKVVRPTIVQPWRQRIGGPGLVADHPRMNGSHFRRAVGYIHNEIQYLADFRINRIFRHE